MNQTIKHIILTLIFLGLFCGLSFANAESSDTYGTAPPNPKLPSQDFVKINQKYGNKAGFQQNVSDPFTNGGTWSNNSGEGTYQTQLTARGSEKFLELFSIPSGTGDIELTIKQDTDLDGTFDMTYPVAGKLSGACGNGFVICEPGTWERCEYFRWFAQPDGTLYYNEVPLSMMGGCFCFNNSCGYGLAMSNVGHIMETLGGGAVAAIQEQKPEYVVTGSLIDGTLISFSGNDASKPPQELGKPTPDDVNQQIFAKNPMSLGAMGRAKAMMAGDDDIFKMTTRFNGMPDTARYNCREENYFTMQSLQTSDVISFAGGDGSVSSCGERCLQLVFGVYGDNYWPHNLISYKRYANFKIWYPNLIESAIFEWTRFDDWLRFFVEDEIIYQGPIDDQSRWPVDGVPVGDLRSFIRYPNIDMTHNFKNAEKGGTLETKIHVRVIGKGEGFTVAKIRLSDMLCTLNQQHFENCENYRVRDDCRLISEKVDGVETIRNGNPTGLIPQASTRWVEDGNCVEEHTLDWWVKERTYECDTEHYGDFDGFKERANTIDENTSRFGSTLTYKDDTGMGVETKTVELGAVTYGDGCQQMCKTKVPTVNTSILSEHQNLSDYNVNTQSTAYNYYECLPDYGCPAPNDEILVKDCQCISEFAEAAAAMMTLEQAGKDTTCSSGEELPIPPPENVPDSYTGGGK